MKTKTLNKLLKDYAKICTTLGFKINPNFEKDFLHIKRMKTNSTKISFIKKDKIEGLEKNVVDFVLNPNCAKQREKYFTAVKPSKFLASMILQDNSKTDLFFNISLQFSKDFINNLKSKLVLFSENEINEQYSKNSSVVGCMSGMHESYFDVYAQTENLQLATLRDEGDTLLIRSLLWYDKETNNYWLDNSYEQSAINGDNEIRKEYQKKLIIQVLNFLQDEAKKDFNFGCAFAYKLPDEDKLEIEKEYNLKIYTDVQTKKQLCCDEKEETENSKNRITLQPLILDFNYDDFESYPYSDTFKSIGRYGDNSSGKYFCSSNSGDDDFVCLQSQNGEDENNTGTICQCCDDRYNEDDVSYSDYDDAYYCYDCATYSDYEEDTILNDNLVEHNRTGDMINTDRI